MRISVIGSLLAIAMITSTVPSVDAAPPTDPADPAAGVLEIAGLRLEAKMITTRKAHTCALDEGGRAYCWGVNTKGQLGVGDNENRTVPTAVAGGHTFTAIAAGADHTCAITAAGEAWCWGANGYGRLGNGEIEDANTPVRVDTDLRFESITAGVDHSCAITTEKKAYCWGRGNWAKLGNGKAGARYHEPRPVAVSTSLEFASINAGNMHTCAIATDGRGYCWGNDANGRAGAGLGSRLDEPIEILGNHRYTSINAGTSYTCGLTTEGEIYCFGVNRSLMQGHGLEDGDAPLAQTEPMHAVAGGHKWSYMSASHAHTCGITTTGETWCWGNAGQGRLGNGERRGLVPTPVKVRTDQTFREVAVGWTHTCGITTGNEVYCWGSGVNGRLGNGSARAASSPVRTSAAAGR